MTQRKLWPKFLSPGDRALCVSIGVFGDRFADIGKTYGVDVELLSFEQGTVRRNTIPRQPCSICGDYAPAT